MQHSLMPITKKVAAGTRKVKQTEYNLHQTVHNNCENTDWLDRLLRHGMGASLCGRAAVQCIYNMRMGG